MNTTSYTDIKNLIKEKARVPRLEKREEIITEYLDQKDPESKKHLCRFFLQGECIFSAEQCHFAHGAADLLFTGPPLEPFLEKLKATKAEGKLSKDIGNNMEDVHEKKTKEQRKKQQPSLNMEKTFKQLFEFQPKMVEIGELDRLYTQEEIDNYSKVQGPLRDVFHRDLQQKLTEVFFGYYQVQFLPKGVVEACFLKIGWYPKFRKIVNCHYCYEVEHPAYGPVITRLPRKNDFDELIENCLVMLFRDYGLFQKIPVRTSVVQELYQNNLAAKDVFLPPMNCYISARKWQLDDILQSFQEKESFIRKLAAALELREEDIVGRQLFEHEKGQNMKQRNEIIETYKARKVANGKAELCRFYMRGLCIFEAKDCKFAHGVTDLTFKKIDIEEYDSKAVNEKRKDEELKEWEKNCMEILKDRQPSLNLEFSYKDIYDYQFKLIEQNIIKEAYSRKEINDEEPKRRDIKAHMHAEITKQFVSLLFETYGRQYLKRSFIDKCFQSIGWVAIWHYILDGEFCYEVKSNELGFVILKIPPVDELHSLMQDSVVKIIKEFGLLHFLPIASVTISKYFYKELVPRNPLMPTLQIYLKRTGKNIEKFLLSLQTEPEFISKLAKECNKTEEEIRSLVLFDSSATELRELTQKMKKILNEMIEKSNIGFILFSRFEETVIKKCSKEVARFNNNLGFLKKLMKGTAIATGVLVINLLSEAYLFSIQKFKSVDVEAIGKKYTNKLHSRCKKKEIKRHYNSENPLIIKGSDEKPEEKGKVDNLNAEIDLSKIRIIDNEESLNEAKKAIAGCEILAVDLEGNLNINGMIELIQIGCGDIIFIFDMYKAQFIEESKVFYNSLVAYIKEIMEDSKKCKVFHDSRKDSLALHLFTDSCPVNVFDISAMHTLVEHLEIYWSFKDDIPLGKEEERKVNENEDEIFKRRFEKGLGIINYIDGIKAPNLNEILRAYAASHGINHLKSSMRRKFEEMPKEYFLKRPLDKEYLIYSAKDVEDLVEVKRTIEDKVCRVLNKMTGVGENTGLMEFLWKKVSKTYVFFGCVYSNTE